MDIFPSHRKCRQGFCVWEFEHKRRDAANPSGPHEDTTNVAFSTVSACRETIEFQLMSRVLVSPCIQASTPICYLSLEFYLVCFSLILWTHPKQSISSDTKWLGCGVILILVEFFLLNNIWNRLIRAISEILVAFFKQKGRNYNAPGWMSDFPCHLVFKRSWVRFPLTTHWK